MQYLLFDVKNTTGRVMLNRPDALNALNAEMTEQLHEKLAHWEMQEDVHQVLISSPYTRAFCAGGDIREVYSAHQKGDKNIKAYFKKEYALNTTIKFYKKRYIAIINGITMGGGLGISVHGALRIAANNLVLAMPETGIGFFPDVGATYFLSRCPGQIGVYLGLTGAQMNATEALYAGLVDHIVGESPSLNRLEIYREAIDRCFNPTTVEEILEALLKENTDWATNTHNILMQRSPTSLKLTLWALRQARHQDFNACMVMEYRLACYCLEGHDFFEGIRAAVIDKDKRPRWQPATLAEVDEKALLSLL